MQMFTLIAHTSISTAVTNKASGASYDDSLLKQAAISCLGRTLHILPMRVSPLPDCAATLMKRRSRVTEIPMPNRDGLLQRAGAVKLGQAPNLRTLHMRIPIRGKQVASVGK